MLYFLLKILLRFSLRIFFRKLHFRNAHLIPKKGPLIIVSNHPNTLMDPLVIAAQVHTKVHFLANGSLFSTPFKAWCCSQLFMIPIYRKKDLTKGVSGDNQAVFRKCYEFLAKKGTLLIFPEGTSVHQRRLREIKTGTARIGLGVEAENEFNLGLQILTIGLNYSNPQRFRSDLLVNIDAPIKVADFQKQYQTAPKEAVKTLSEEIRKRLENHTIVTQTDTEDQLAKDISLIFRKHWEKEPQTQETLKQQEFQQTKGIINAIHYFEKIAPQRLDDVKLQIENYFQRLERLHLKDTFVEKGIPKKGLFWLHLKNFLLTLFFLPLHIYGLLNNYIPYIIPSKVAYKMTKETEYIAPIMLLIGILVFPVFYALQILGIHLLWNLNWLTISYAISLPLSAFLSLYISKYIGNVTSYLRLLSLFRSRKKLLQLLSEQRENIITTLLKAKEEYLLLNEK